MKKSKEFSFKNLKFLKQFDGVDEEDSLEILRGDSTSKMLYSSRWDKIFIGVKTKKILIFNPETYVLESELLGHKRFLTDLFETKNGNLVSSCFDDTVKIWDIEKKECIQTLILPEDLNKIDENIPPKFRRQKKNIGIKSILYLLNGTIVAITSEGHILFWNESNYQLTSWTKHPKHKFDHGIEIPNERIAFISWAYNEDSSIIFFNYKEMKFDEQNDIKVDFNFEKAHKMMFYDKENLLLGGKETITIVNVNNYTITHSIKTDFSINATIMLRDGSFLLGTEENGFYHLKKDFSIEKQEDNTPIKHCRQIEKINETTFMSTNGHGEIYIWTY